VKQDRLLNSLKKYNSVLVALSGGVDSAVVAAMAFLALGDSAVAVTFNSPLSPPGELQTAKNIAKTIGIKLLVESSNELSVSEITPNPLNRCYHCKRYRFNQALLLAKRMGLAVVVDGTTASDVEEHRPGLQALQELGIQSPLLEVGITKEETRKLAIQLKIPIADKPPNSCLATRIPYGEKLTIKRLSRIAKAEEKIREIVQVGILRVRDHGELARLEVAPQDFAKMLQPTVSIQIVAKLKDLGYKHITLDLTGYRFGSFDEPL
jgi:uncharacterized protein